MITGIFYNDIQFFRFYKDGIFIDCLIKGFDPSTDSEKIYEGFQRKNLGKGTLLGNYTFKGKNISFTTFTTLNHFGDERSICYEGEYQKDRLILNSLDHNTGRRILGRVFMRC
jgi:hypothetical protein